MKTNIKTKIFSAALSVLVVTAFQLPLAQSASAAVIDWEKGISVVPTSQNEYSTDNFKQSMRNFKATGGNYVNFIVPYYQSNLNSSDIGPGWNTPSDQSLADGIQYIHSIGMHAQISIYIESKTGEWRANINPSDRTSWFKNYGDVLAHYGQLGQQNGAEQYMLGAEIVGVTSDYINPDNTTQWKNMIARVRGVYSGKLTYGANRGNQGDWLSEDQHIEFWDKLDYIGISAYYELWGDGSQQSLENGWNAAYGYDIAPLAQKWNKPILFTEVGYRSVTNAHNQPWNSGMSGNYDPQEQANDYTAMLDFWNGHSEMQGAFLWWWSSDPNYGGNGNTDYTPQNKPAQDVLKQWWLGSSPATPPPPAGTPAFKTSANVNPASPSAGQAASLSASVADTGDATNGAIVDLEVYNGSSRVFQQHFDGQNFASGQSQSYAASWTPSSAGTYTMKIGIFSSGWAQTYSWNDNASSITVGQGGSSTPPPNNPPPGNPPASGQATDIWWPSDGGHVSGVQPFKALLENIGLSQYTMFWQVDTGGLVQMYDSSQDWPHKEAMVDLSNWNWKGAGPYTINFVSKDAGGNTLGQKSVQIFTQ